MGGIRHTAPRAPAHRDHRRPPPTVERDDAGNAVGGIRLPELEVPIGSYSGTIEGETQRQRAILGSWEPFTPEEIAARYPTQQTYLDAFAAAVQQGIDDGYLLAEDAELLNTTAAQQAPTLFPG